MLLAYADASTEHDELFVLAGYIAPDDKWARFSDEWQAELDRPPNKLAVFKMKDQAKRHHRRAERFYRVIEKHVTMAVSVSVRIPELREVVDEARWPPQLGSVEQLKNPYFYAFQMMMSGFGDNQQSAGIREPVSFIFDDQTEREVIYRNWAGLKASLTGDAARLLGDDPVFKDDENVLPLQAADLWAWWVRHWATNGDRRPGSALNFPWKAERDILRLGLDSTKDDIRTNLKPVLDRAWLAATYHSLTYGPVSWCKKSLAFN